MSQQELLRRVIEVLDQAKVPYMLTGSYVSSFQGEPRATHDIDFVVAMTPAGSRALLLAFPPPDFYLDPVSIASAVASKTQFNLLDATGGDKVDFWILGNEAFNKSAFSRRYVEVMDGQNVFLPRPEDTILSKLRWAEMCGGSEKQFRDVKGVYEMQYSNLDLAYIEHWVAILNVRELWERVKREGDPIP